MRVIWFFVVVFAIAAALVAPTAWLSAPHIGYLWTGPHHGHDHRVIYAAWLKHHAQFQDAYFWTTVIYLGGLMIAMMFIWPYWIFMRNFRVPGLRALAILAFFGSLTVWTIVTLKGVPPSHRFLDGFAIAIAIGIFYLCPCIGAYIGRAGGGWGLAAGAGLAGGAAVAAMGQRRSAYGSAPSGGFGIAMPFSPEAISAEDARHRNSIAAQREADQARWDWKAAEEQRFRDQREAENRRYQQEQAEQRRRDEQQRRDDEYRRNR